MSVENNKKIILDYIAAVNRTDPEAIGQFLTEDFLFEAKLRRPEWLLISWTKEKFASAPAFMSSRMKTPIQMKVLGMIGEGDQVAVEAESYGVMKSGKIYDQAYHFVFKLRDNKICNVKEYSCSYTGNEVFGEFSSDF